MAALQRGARCLECLEERLLGLQAGGSLHGIPGAGRPVLVTGKIMKKYLFFIMFYYIYYIYFY